MPLTPTLSEIIAAEQYFNSLLPQQPVKTIPLPLVTAGKDWSLLVWQMAVDLGPVNLSEQDISSGLALAQRPVFICGVHRSGTTLLRDLLDDHPELLVLPSEGSYFTQLEKKLKKLPNDARLGFIAQEWLRRLANPINRAPYWLLGSSTQNGSNYVTFARYLLAWWQVVPRTTSQWPHIAIMLAYASSTNKLSAGFWVDKTPLNEFYLEKIYKEMPAAKIIHLVREPFAVLSSRKKMEPGVNFNVALGQLKRSFKIAAEQAKKHNRRHLMMRYEDLCNEPQKSIAQVSLLLNIIPLPSLNHPSVAGYPVAPNSSFDNQAKAGIIVKQTLNNSATILTRTEKRAIAVALHRYAPAIGYKICSVSWPLKVLSAIKNIWQLALQRNTRMILQRKTR